MNETDPPIVPMITRLALATLSLLMVMGCADARSGDHEDRLHRAVEDVASDHPEALFAVAVVDPATQTRFEVNGDSVLHAASMMKVPVMIEVFRQAEEGRFSLDDSLVVENRFRSIVDGSEFSIETDSDDGIYDALGGRMSIHDLTRNMITVSSNLATNMLIDYVSPDSVRETVRRLGGSGVEVLRGVEDLKAFEQGLNNTATASGLAALFEVLMEGRAVSAEADRQMIDILLDQRFTSIIPAGLPDDVRVAHKTGWITRIHHDGGIVYPPGSAPYVLVVMMRGIDDEARSAAAGARIAAAVHQVLRPD